MELVVATSPAEVGHIAADRIATALSGRADPVLGVATGSSPLGTYRALAAMVADGRLDLSRTRAVALDEYVGLDPSDEHSYAETIRRTVTVPLGLDPSLVHVPDGAADDLEAACARHEQVIRDAGGVDVQLLGIGRNGHVGFNEPGSPADGRTRVAALSDSTRQANARFFDSPDDVPTHCLTQGLGTIMDARHLVLVAQGEEKAEAVAAMVEGPVTTDCPASLLQRHPSVLVVVDEAAAGRLTRR